MKERIPREFIQTLLNRLDLVDLIDTRVPLRKKTGQHFFACCPFHQEKSASFSVNQSKQFFYCFGCGIHGNAIDFLMQYDHLTFREAIEVLAKETGLAIPYEKKSNDQSDQQESLLPLMETITDYYQKNLRNQPHAITYLKNRGVTGEMAKQFKIGFSHPSWDHLLKTLGTSETDKAALATVGMIIKKEDGGYYDRFRGRIMYPILSRHGKVIGFGGRVLDQSEPKYLNSPETPLFQKGHELYGLHQALAANRTLKQVLIVEGYMDVIALFQAGITYSVATLGTATTPHHLKRLFRYTAELIFCFDGDKAGRTAAWRALEVTLPEMRDGMQIRFMFLPQGEDPDSLIRKEGKDRFEKRMPEALSIADFFFHHLAEETDLTSIDGRARYVKLAKEYLTPLPDTVFKQMLFEELSKRARTSVEYLAPKKKMILQSTATKRTTPSALRTALTLLIQNPVLINSLQEPLPALEMPGFDLLETVVNTLKETPVPTTGGLLEIFRELTEINLIAKFAQLEILTPAQGVEKEFLGAIKHLKKLAHKQTIEKLLSRAAVQDLNREEKQQLESLIKETP